MTLKSVLKSASFRNRLILLLIFIVLGVSIYKPVERFFAEPLARKYNFPQLTNGQQYQNRNDKRNNLMGSCTELGGTPDGEVSFTPSTASLQCNDGMLNPIKGVLLFERDANGNVIKDANGLQIRKRGNQILQRQGPMVNFPYTTPATSKGIPVNRTIDMWLPPPHYFQ